MTSPLLPPERKALSDGELAARLEQIQSVSGPLAGIDFLQAQTLLRAEDEAAFAGWAREMERIGSTDALAALDAARRDQMGLSINEAEPAVTPSRLPGDLAALGDWQQRAIDAEAAHTAQIAIQKAAEHAAAAALEVATEREALERIARDIELLEKQAVQEVARLVESELAAQASQEQVAVEEPEPNRATDYATGSFEIVESIDESDEAFDSVIFDKVSDGDQIAFAKEGESAFSIANVVRRSRALSQLFVWGGVGAGLIPVLLGFIFSNTVTPLGPVLIALFFGYAIAATFIASVAIAGKRSGLQTLVLSRAAFGVNVGQFTSILVLISKIVIGTALIGALVSAAFGNSVVGVPELSSPVSAASSLPWLVIAIGVFAVIAIVPATLGGRVLYYTQLVGGVLGLVAALVYLVGALPALDLAKVNWFDRFDQPQLALTIGITGLLAALYGGFWATSAADFTRHVPMSEPGKRVALYVGLTAGLVPLLLTAFGALIAKASTHAASTADQSVIMQLLGNANGVLGTVVLLGLGVSIVVWLASWLNSSSIGLRSIASRLNRYASQAIVLVVMLISAVSAAVIDIATIRSLAAVLLVFTMAYLGVFIGDIWTRRAAYDKSALVSGFGIYGSARWLNFASFIFATIVGLGFTSSSFDSIFVTNFIGRFIPTVRWADSQAGLYFALAIALIATLVLGRKQVRQQETQLALLDARRGDLTDVDVAELFS